MAGAYLITVTLASGDEAVVNVASIAYITRRTRIVGLLSKGGHVETAPGAVLYFGSYVDGLLVQDAYEEILDLMRDMAVPR